MYKAILLLLVLTFYGCSKVEDDTDNGCTSDCTTIQGRFVTLGNVGIQGVKVSVKYRIHGGELGGGYIRKIVETETDQNGNFYNQFYIKDDELGNLAKGYFKVEMDDSNLDVDKYILSDNLIGNSSQPLGFAIYAINSRDTIIGNTYYLPKKTYIKVNLNNFVPIQNDDYFEVRTLYPFGPNVGHNDFLDSEYATGYSGYDNWLANGLNTQLMPYVAENERNIIRIARRKNGVNTIEDFPLLVPTNNSIELTYDY